MHVAVLTSPESWYFNDLRRAAAGRHQLVAVSFRQLSSQVSQAGVATQSGEFDLQDPNVLLIRSMPPASLEQVVFRMDALAQLELAGVTVVNPPRAIEAAVDKYLTSARLQRAGMPVPQTIACQTAEAALDAFEQLGGDVVVKPLFGSEGRGILRVRDKDAAYRVLRSLEQVQSVLYLQKFIEHEGCDYRLLTIGSQVLGMRRSNRLDWRTNVSRGAEAEFFEAPAKWRDLAQRAAAAVGACVAGVDLLPGRDGRIYVLEVNAVPGWRALSRVTGVDVAERVLDFVEQLALAKI